VRWRERRTTGSRTDLEVVPGVRGDGPPRQRREDPLVQPRRPALLRLHLHHVLMLLGGVPVGASVLLAHLPLRRLLHLPEDGIGLGRRLAGRRRSSLTSRSAKLVSASWEWGHGKHCSGPRAYIGKGSAGGRSGAWGGTAHWVGSGGLVVGRHV